MREIYGDHADYIDLAVNSGDVDRFTPGHDARAVLQRYSWTQSARKLRDLIREEPA